MTGAKRLARTPSDPKVAEQPPGPRLLGYGSARRPGVPLTLVFDHIPKTGGTTLTSILRPHFPLVRRVNSPLSWATLRDLLRSRPGEDAFLSGHLARGVEGLHEEDRDAAYFTFLRHPLSWLRSYIHFLGVMRLHGEDALAFYRRHCELNIQTRYVGGGCLETARRRLEKDFLNFGILERYDESLALLGRALGIGLRDYRQQNRSGSEALALPDAIADDFRERSALDFELYDHARSLFDQRAAGLQCRGPAGSIDETSATASLCGRVLSGHGQEEVLGQMDLNHTALIHVRQGEFQAAVDTFERIHPDKVLNPLAHAEALHHVDPDQAIRHLEDLIARLGPLADTLPMDAALVAEVDRMRLNLARYLQAAGRQDEALDQTRATRSHPGLTHLGRPVPPLTAPDAVLASCGRTLVVRSGTMLLFGSLVRQLQEAGAGPVDAAVQRDALDAMDRRGLRRVVELPPGRYVHDPDMEARFAGQRYDTVFLLNNGRPLEEYAEQLKLVRALKPGRVLVYPLANLSRQGPALLYDITDIPGGTAPDSP